MNEFLTVLPLYEAVAVGFVRRKEAILKSSEFLKQQKLGWNIIDYYEKILWHSKTNIHWNFD